MKTETRGRKPLPADKKKPPQATVKINDAILPFVKELKGNLKNKALTPDVLQSLFDVLRGDRQTIHENTDTAFLVDDLQRKITELETELSTACKQNNVTEIQHKLVAKYDAEHQKVLNLESSNSRLKSQLKEIKVQFEQLQHKEHDCQALTKSGERCTKPAKLLTDWHGVEIHTCLQHSKKR